MDDIDADIRQKLEVGDGRVKQAFYELVRIRAMLQEDLAECEAKAAELASELADLQAKDRPTE